MMDQLRMAARKNPRIALLTAGRSLEGRIIPLVILNDPRVPLEDTLRIMILCRQHGDEAASTEGMLRLLRHMAGDQEPRLPALLDRITYLIFPMINPDGVQRFRRDNAAGVDLNRDWGVFSQPETQAVWKAFRQWRPQIVVDMHEWTSRDPHYRNMVEAPGEKTPVARELGHIARFLQKETVARLETHGSPFQRVRYRPVRNPRLAHRYFATQEGVLAFLFETQPQSIPAFERRVSLYPALALHLGRLLQRNFRELKERLDRIEKLEAWSPSGLPQEARPAPIRIARRQKLMAGIWIAILAYGLVLFTLFQRQNLQGEEKKRFRALRRQDRDISEMRLHRREGSVPGRNVPLSHRTITKRPGKRRQGLPRNWSVAA